MKQLKQIENLFLHIFKTRNTLISSEEIKKYSDLEKKGIIKSKSQNEYEIDLYSIDLYNYLKELVSKKVSESITDDISESFKIINNVEKLIKEENGFVNIINAYSDVFNSFKVNFLVELDKKGIDITSYYIELKKQTNVIYELKSFDSLFFNFLLFKDLKTKQLVIFLEENDEENSRYYLNNYLHSLVDKKEDFSISLIDQLVGKHQEETPHYLIILITSIINKGKTEYLELLKGRLLNNVKEIFWAYSLLNVNTKLVYNNLLELIQNDTSVDYLYHKSTIIESLMNSQFITTEDSETLSKKLFEYFKNPEDNEIHNYFNSIIYGFAEYEDLKYALLHSYLERTKNWNTLDSFFHNIKDSKYLFDLIILSFNTKWTRNSINVFSQSLSHFWSTSREKTEDFILSLISTKQKAGLLPIEIIMTGRDNPMSIDLLNLKSEDDQKLAMSMFCNYPLSFDKLLPVLLQLINSPFPKVIENLQLQLSILVCECYNEILIEWLENLIPKSRKKISFLKPIKKALELYKEIKELKHKNNDLNPYYNEKSNMDLYYSLENENRAKMMESVRNNPSGFSSMFKNTSIIRGNSWRFEHEENVMPLGKVETQMYLDTRIYKNPELYEYQLERFNK